jgi:hypothetical protein
MGVSWLRDMAALSIAATQALSFIFFPGKIRERLRFEAPAVLSLISDGWARCTTIFIAGAYM